MSQERLLELQKRLFELDKKIKPLEWDSSRDQINEFKKLELERLKTEFKSVSEETAKLKSSLPQE